MKRYLNIIAIGFLCMGMFSCKKDSFNYPEGTVGISKITNYPTFTINGDPFMSIIKGQSFTDPGATAKEGSNDLKVTVSGSVNTGVAGLYDVTYSAVNKDGFAGTAVRKVAVLPSAVVAGATIAGDYNYAAGGTTSTVSMLAPGFFQASNIWSAATTISAYLISIDGKNIIIPSQTNGFGTLSGTGTLDANGNLQYVATIPEQGINNSVRKWVKK